jgi:ubiquitin-conjugating enzyme E2 W
MSSTTVEFSACFASHLGYLGIFLQSQNPREYLLFAHSFRLKQIQYISILPKMTSLRLLIATVQLLGFLLISSAAIFVNPVFLHSSPSFARATSSFGAEQDNIGIVPQCAIFFRGGGIDLASDEEGGFVLTKVRNLIRSVLKFGDKKIPPLSSILRGFLKTLESITGTKLLPVKKSKKPKNKKGSKAKNGNKKQTDEKEGDGDEKPQTAKKSLKKPSAATKKHLSSTIKNTNPNYRIQRELKEFIKSPPPSLSVQVGSNIRVWIVTMVGAKNSIYEGEVFKLRVSFPPQYPTVPPSVYFIQGHIPTHEHVYTNGDICLSLLGKDWRPTMTAQSIAVSILSILSSAQSKSLPMDNARHAGSKPGEYQKDWVYHDDNC